MFGALRRENGDGSAKPAKEKAAPDAPGTPWRTRSDSTVRRTIVAIACILLWFLRHHIDIGIDIFQYTSSNNSCSSCAPMKHSSLSIFSVIADLVTTHRWGRPIGPVALLMAGQPGEGTNVKAPYVSEAKAGINVLQQWYDGPTGLWNSTGWWNSANCLTVLVDFGLLGLDAADPGSPSPPDIRQVIANTYINAQLVRAFTKKSMRADWLVQSSYTLRRRTAAENRGFSGFLNDFYDDEGWWALAFIRGYDYTHEAKYLAMAEDIFADMVGGTDSVCGGGMWWSKKRTYKNAVANELFLSVAASLANRCPSSSSARRDDYAQLAADQWAWFQHSGMLNGQGTINDGLTIGPDGACANNGGQVWSYNQGVVLGGLVELAALTGDRSLLLPAARIARAAIGALSSGGGGGILRDPCEPACGADGPQFKGVFLRNLRALQAVAPEPAFADFIVGNADAILGRAANPRGQFGLVWSGPPAAGGEPTAASHSSALDAILAAVAVAR